jgi:autotransporter-associated beta strand protein
MEEFFGFVNPWLRALFLTLALSWTGQTWAQSFTWNGTSSGDWGNSTKWVGGTAPSGNATIFFNVTSGGGGITATNNLTLSSVTGLTVNSTNNRTITILGTGFLLDGNINMNRASSILSIGNAAENFGDITLNRTISITANTSSTVRIYGNISENASGYGINKLGAGTLALNGTVDISGLISVSNGTVRLGITAGSASGSFNSAASLLLSGPGTFDVNGSTQAFASLNGTGGNVTLGTTSAGALTINQSSDTVFAGNISGNGSFTKSNSGCLTLSGSNSYNGTTTISGGTLRIGNGGTSGNLSTSSAITNDGTLTFNRSNDVTQGTDFASNISGSGNLIQSGSGNLVLTSGNTYAGVTTLNSGTLKFNSIANGGLASAIGQSSNAAANLVLNGGTLDYTGPSASTDRGFTVSASSSINVGSGVSLNFSGSTTGGGTLTKAGSGTLEFSGSSVGHASTTVNAGSLLVSGSLSGTITVGNGGTLLGAGTVGGLTTLNSGANLTPGNGVGTITFNNGLTLNGGTVTMNIAGAISGSADQINVAGGSLTRGGTVVLSFDSALPAAYSEFTRTYDLLAGSGTGNFGAVQLGGLYSGSFNRSDSIWTRNTGDGYVFTFDQSTGDLTVIPEPSTWALLSFGAAFVVWRVRRRVCIVESLGAGRDNCSGGLRPPVCGTN